MRRPAPRCTGSGGAPAAPASGAAWRSGPSESLAPGDSGGRPAPGGALPWLGGAPRPSAGARSLASTMRRTAATPSTLANTPPRDTDGGDERERRATGPSRTRPRERAAARTTFGLSEADGGPPPSAPAALAAAAAEERVIRPRPDMLDSGGWKAENAGTCVANCSGELATRSAFQAGTCPTRAVCTGRTAEYKVSIMAAIVVLSAATDCTVRWCCSDCWPGSAAPTYFLCGYSSFEFNQWSQRLSRSATTNGRL